jgi:hypothetical protein
LIEETECSKDPRASAALDSISLGIRVDFMAISLE